MPARGARSGGRRRRRWWRSTLAALAVYQWRRAEDASRLAESGEHAAQSLAVARSDPEESLRLAIQAVERAETPTANDALRRALEGSVVRKLWSVPLVRASAVAFSPEGRRLAAGGAAFGNEPGRAGIWDVETGSLQSSVCGHDVAGLRWMPDGRGLLLGLENVGVVYWDPGGREGASPVTELVAGRDLKVWDLDVRPDGRELAVAAGSEGLLRFELAREPGAGRPLARSKPLREGVLRKDDDVSSVAYSPDGRWLAAGGSKGTVTVIDTASGERHCSTSPLPEEILRVGFGGTDLGRVGASSFDHVLRSWPLPDCGSTPVRFTGHREDVWDFAFTRGGDYLVSVSDDGSIKLWDPVKGDELFTRRLVIYDSDRKMVRYDLKRVATLRSPASAHAGAPGRIPIATLGAPEQDDLGGESMTLWDLAPRGWTDDLNRRTAQAPAALRDQGQELLQRARRLQRKPLIRADQVPDCSTTPAQR